MPLPRELNPSSPGVFSRELFTPDIEKQDLHSGTGLQERVMELESRNIYLQTLVVELLDKNEQLRRKVAQQEKPDDDVRLSNSPRS